MAGAKISIELDDRELREWIGTTLARLTDPSDALSEIGEVLQASTKARFASQTDPDGRRWKENRQVTRARKRNPNILTEDGYLGDTIDHQLAAGGRAVEIGSPMDYAATHQFGADRGAFGTTRRGAPIPWGDIPPRPFLGTSDDDAERIREILADYLTP